jgi:hypothetical protein
MLTEQLCQETLPNKPSLSKFAEQAKRLFFRKRHAFEAKEAQIKCLASIVND